MKKQNDNPLMEEVRDAVLDLRVGVRGDRISLTLVLTSRQPQGRALSPRYQLACGYQVYKILVCEQICRRLINFLWHPVLSTRVTLCPCLFCWGSLHSLALCHTAVARRPPWENGISTRPQPCDPAWAELSESTASALCTSHRKLWDEC